VTCAGCQLKTLMVTANKLVDPHSTIWRLVTVKPLCLLIITLKYASLLTACHALCLIQSSSTRSSRTESECSSAAVAELAGKMADIDVVDSCHDDASLPAAVSLVDAGETEPCQRDVITDAERDCSSDSQQPVDVEDRLIPSADEDDFEDGDS